MAPIHNQNEHSLSTTGQLEHLEGRSPDRGPIYERSRLALGIGQALADVIAGICRLGQAYQCSNSMTGSVCVQLDLIFANVGLKMPTLIRLCREKLAKVC
ncbi:unnamed protein product [Protopolystoma xenopodis]|uniref:Uncharacterized protein n=1 Tax=Protopolystoma xenopodis TaxID=117903 RepID=A0A448X4K2_9PLAT|nr:unnamed protein product [Protopolystoma xenopodis]